MSAPASGSRPPQQERSRRSRERILEAGVVLFAEHGYDGLSIAEVCRRAEVSAGALYGRFASKDDLVHAIHDHAMSALTAEGIALYADGAHWRELSTPDLVEHAVRLLLGHFRRNADILRSSILRSASDAHLRRAGLAAMEPVAHAFSDRLLERSSDFPHADPTVAVSATFAIAFEAVAWDVAFGADYRSSAQIGAEAIDVRLPAVCRMYLLNAPGS